MMTYPSTNQDTLNSMLQLFKNENPTQEDYKEASNLWYNLRSIPLSIALYIGAMLQEYGMRVS